jgi:hypothetical protein
VPGHPKFIINFNPAQAKKKAISQEQPQTAMSGHFQLAAQVEITLSTPVGRAGPPYGRIQEYEDSPGVATGRLINYLKS